MKKIILPILLISSSGFTSVIFNNGDDNNQVQFSLYQGLVSNGSYTTSYTNGAYCDGVTCVLPSKNSSITLDMINDNYNFSAIAFMYNFSQVDGTRYPDGDFSHLNPEYSVVYGDDTTVVCAPRANLYLNVHAQANPEASCPLACTDDQDSIHDSLNLYTTITTTNNIVISYIYSNAFYNSKINQCQMKMGFDAVHYKCNWDPTNWGNTIVCTPLSNYQK